MNIEHKSETSVRVVHEETINAPVQDVFPLACPVLEYKWIPGWKCELIHCPKGYVEKGTVFNEIMSAPILNGSASGKTTWTAVLHDSRERRVHYQLKNRASLSLYKIEMKEVDPGKTMCHLDLSYEAQNEKGKRIIRNKGAEKISFMLTLLMAMLKHYAEQGEMLGSMDIKKMAFRFKYFSTKDKFRLMLSEISMKIMKDKDRIKFFQGVPISVNR